MNQMRWVYIDDAGERHKVGLLHGESTGHMLIHCNSQISLVDFEVLSDKKYSLYINQQLCHIEISKVDKKFSYGFEIDRDADTALNRRRKAQAKKHNYQSVAFMFSLFALVACAIYFLLPESDPLSMIGTEVNSEKFYLGIISDYDESASAMTVKVLGSTAESDILIDGNHKDNYLLKLPWTIGDTVSIHSQSQLTEPDVMSHRRKGNLALMESRITNQIKTRFPDLQNERIVCIVESTSSSYGLKGLADLLLISNSVIDQANIESFNPNVYQKFVSGCR